MTTCGLVMKGTQMASLPLKDHLSLARLDGRAYMVLGAGGGGLGDATCEALAGAGARLLCIDRSEEQARAIAPRAAMWDRLAAANPLRRAASPEDIAKAILFLASDLADGNILTLDGGISQSLALSGTDALREAQK